MKKIVEPQYSDRERKSLSSSKQPTTLSASERARKRLLSQRSLLLGVGCIASLAFLSQGTVWAQAEALSEEVAVPAQVEPQPVFEAAPEVSEPAAIEPDYSQPEPAAVAPEPPPEPEYIPPAPAAEAAPEPYYEPESPVVAEPPPPEPSASEWNAEAPTSPANSYIDPTDYSIGATDSYEAPTAVHFSDRSNGCDAVLQSGQAISGALCTPPPVSEPMTADANPGYGGSEESGYRGPVAERPWEGGSPSSPAGTGLYNPDAATAAREGYYPATSNSSGSEGTLVSGLSSIQVGPISVTSTSNLGFAYYNRTVRPPAMPGNGNIRMLFPLSIPAPITSLFGWRNHPVLGYSRFHTGTDLGAPLGTPVLAAFAGQVAIADWLGGYGLTVILDHKKQAQETLYAHLSEIFVKPGESVQQGEVIGRVGSTGMSTGPHLHFELRQMTKDGWVAIDPGAQLEFALAQMLQPLQSAQKVPVMPKIVALKDLEGMPQLPPLPQGIDIDIPNLQPPLPQALLEPKNQKTLTAQNPKPRN